MSTELDLLQRSAMEIKTLRSQNQLMSARLEMFDKMMVLLHTEPNYPGMGASPDVVWEIQKYIDAQQPKVNAD